MTTNTNPQGTSATASADLPMMRGPPTYITSAAAHAQSESDFDVPVLEVEFVPAKCLFCPLSSPNLSSNLLHMRQKHGLFIPHTVVVDGIHPKVLAVDEETLVRYMHLVIFDDRECVFCHTQRRSVLAVQQHMMDRGHCRMDLEGSESEFLDFYEGDVGEDEETGDEDGSEAQNDTMRDEESTGQNMCLILSMTDGNSLRLSSGKVLSRRSVNPPPRMNRRPLAEPKSRRHGNHGLLLEYFSSSMPTTDASGPSTQVALTRSERRVLTHGAGALTVALSQMSQGDRASLAHLSLAEQRATIVKQFRQQDKAKHEERKYWGKFDLKLSMCEQRRLTVYPL